MNDESTLRAVLIAAMLVLLPIGMYHRVSSQSTGEKLDRRQEGLFILATLRPLGAAFWFAVFAWMINPRWMAWSSVPLPFWSRWAGVGLLLAGCALLVWTFRSLGKNLTDTVVTRKNHTHGRARPLSLDPASAVFLRSSACRSGVTDCSELVLLRNGRRAAVCPRHANADRGREPRRAVWRELSNVHAPNRAFPSENRGVMTAASRLRRGHTYPARSATRREYRFLREGSRVYGELYRPW